MIRNNYMIISFLFLKLFYKKRRVLEYIKDNIDIKTINQN